MILNSSSKLCLFSSYSELSYIENYIKYYISELSLYYDQIIFLTNTRNLDNDDIKYLESNKANIQFVPNMGYDFGMWHRIITKLDCSNITNLALINDSCILFKPLDNVMNWISTTNFDAYSLTDSNQFSYHLQSYFLVFKKNAVSEVKHFFQLNSIFDQDDINKIIEKYELGLTQHLLQRNLKVTAKYSQSNYPTSINISYQNVVDLINTGIPAIKRKVLTNNFRTNERSFLESVSYDFSIDYAKIIKNSTSSRIYNYITNKKDLKLYQIYYAENQKSQLFLDAIPYHNQNLTVFFENEILPYLYQEADQEYFAVFSWKFSEKTTIPNNLNLADQLDGRYDMYSFQGPHIGPVIYHDVLEDSEKCHPHFIELFSYILKNLNVDITDLQIPFGIYQNAIITRNWIYKEYIYNWLIPTINLLKTLPSDHELYTKLWDNSNYKFDQALQTRILKYTGKPYYTYHTFLCERLWVVFYHLNRHRFNLKIIKHSEILSTNNVIQNTSNPKLQASYKDLNHKSLPETIFKDAAICVAQYSDMSSLKLNSTVKNYDVFLASKEQSLEHNLSLQITKNQHFKQKQIDSICPANLTKTVWGQIYLMYNAHLLRVDTELNSSKYKYVVHCNSLNGLTNSLDFSRMNIAASCLYITTRNGVKYWIGKSETMNIFYLIYHEIKNYSGISFDQAIIKFCLKRGIKIVEF